MIPLKGDNTYSTVIDFLTNISSFIDFPTRALLKNAVGVQLVDDPSINLYPMPLTATESFDVEVGRIRESLIFAPYGLELFVSGDQLLRGAALNAVLIAVKIMEMKK